MSQAFTFVKEGATTRVKTRTMQANGIGSARHPEYQDGDMVCSSWKHEAVSKRDGLSFANLDEHKGNWPVFSCNIKSICISCR